MNNIIDHIVLLLVILIIGLSLVLIRKTVDSYRAQIKAHNRVERLFETTWTGHEETRLYACNLVYQKLGGITMDQHHRRAYQRLLKKVLVNKKVFRTEHKAQSTLTLIQKPEF